MRTYTQTAGSKKITWQQKMKKNKKHAYKKHNNKHGDLVTAGIYNCGRKRRKPVLKKSKHFAAIGHRPIRSGGSLHGLTVT